MFFLIPPKLSDHSEGLAAFIFFLNCSVAVLRMPTRKNINNERHHIYRRDFYFISPNDQRGKGGALPFFFLSYFPPGQQTTSGNGRRVNLSTNTLNVSDLLPAVTRFCLYSQCSHLNL